MVAPNSDLASIADGIGDIDCLPIVDLGHLAAFTDGSEDLEAELADLYLTTARRYLRDMQAALQEDRAWSAEAHALKGASGNLGACRMAALAKEAEFEAPSSARLQLLQQAVDDVAALFAERRD